MKIVPIVIGLIIATLGALGGLFMNSHTSTPPAGNYNPTGGGTYRLQTSVGTSDTSITLSSFKEPISNILYTMGYLNSDIEYGTLDPQSTRSEFVSFTGITQNGDGSATLTGVIRGLARTPGTGGCVASTTLAQAHAGQSIFILSNPPCQLAEYAPLRTTATIKAVWTFGSTTAPTYDFNPTFSSLASTTLVSKGYVDASSLNGGSPGNFTTAGIFMLASSTAAASSTGTGVFNAVTYNRVVSSASATDTPGVLCTSANFLSFGSCLPFAMPNGKLSQSWTDYTLSSTWTGLQKFYGGASSTLESVFSTLYVGGAATTTIQGLTTASSSFSGGVVFNGYSQFAAGATTTNLTISNSCTGCTSTNIVSTVSSACGTANGNTCTITASCSGSQKILGGGGIMSTGSFGGSTVAAYQNYPSSATAWTYSTVVEAGGPSSAYTITAYALCGNP